MNYTRIEQNENKTFSVYFNDNFYHVCSPFYRGGSYFNIFYRLFGLLPQDFYHYIGATYNAAFKPSSLKTLVLTQFKDRTDAINFANEINKRLSYCISRGDFE